MFGIGLFNADGVCCYGTNTYLEEMDPERLAGEAEATFAIDSLDLVEGTYKLDVAVHKRDGFPYDYHRLLYTFRVKSRTHDVGIYRPPHRWSFSPSVTVQVADGPSSGRRLGLASTQPRVLCPRDRLSKPARLSRGSAPAASRSSSPTASSICCTSATSATSAGARRSAMR